MSGPGLSDAANRAFAFGRLFVGSHASTPAGAASLIPHNAANQNRQYPVGVYIAAPAASGDGELSRVVASPNAVGGARVIAGPLGHGPPEGRAAKKRG